MKNIIFAILVISLIANCTPSQPKEINFEPSDSRFIIEYSAEEKSFHDDGILYHAKLLADPKIQELRLNLVAYNSTNNAKEISLANWEVITPNKMRRTANLDSSLVNIKPNETISFSLRFLPVNNLKIFKLTEYKGDLHTKYQVKLNIKTIQFHIKEEHKKLLTKYSKNNNFEIYTLTNKVTKASNSTESEILHKGTVINLKFYSLNDSLHGKISVVNHGEEEIILFPKQTFINYSGKIFTPNKNWWQGGVIHNDTLYLPKGKRFWQKVNFQLPQQPDSFTILTNGFLDLQKKPFIISQPMAKLPKVLHQ